MVRLTIATVGTETSIADAIYRWAQTWPGDERLVVTIEDRLNHETGGTEWPQTVDASVDALLALAMMVEEHSDHFDLQYVPDIPGDGQPHGVAQHRVERSPGLVPILIDLYLDARRSVRRLLRKARP